VGSLAGTPQLKSPARNLSNQAWSPPRDSMICRYAGVHACMWGCTGCWRAGTVRLRSVTCTTQHEAS
jgi:hypothetical protein